MHRYVTVETTDRPEGASAHRVSLPARYIQGAGFTWTGDRWATDLPVAALVQAPGSFVVRAARRG